MADPVLVERNARVAIITINRPERRNAFDLPTAEAVYRVFKQFDANSDGGISKEEWTAAGRPADRFEATDANKDGKVTQEELAAAIQRMMQQRGGEAPGGTN